MGSIHQFARICLVFGLAYLTQASAAETDMSPQRHVFPSLQGSIVAERVLDGLSEPVAIQFLPDGRALVLQRNRGLVTLADFDSGGSPRRGTPSGLRGERLDLPDLLGRGGSAQHGRAGPFPTQR